MRFILASILTLAFAVSATAKIPVPKKRPQRLDLSKLPEKKKTIQTKPGNKVCSRKDETPFSIAEYNAPTQTVLSLVAHHDLEDTGNCYHYRLGHHLMTSYSKHPGKRKGAISSAAGRYQYLTGTWKRVKRLEGLADFSPFYQDIGAVRLMDLRKFQNYGKFLSYTEFAVAMKKISYEWASLPPNRYGQTRVKKIATAYKIYKRIYENREAEVTVAQGDRESDGDRQGGVKTPVAQQDTKREPVKREPVKRESVDVDPRIARIIRAKQEGRDTSDMAFKDLIEPGSGDPTDLKEIPDHDLTLIVNDNEITVNGEGVNIESE